MEMLKCEVSFKYPKVVTIIAFGPDDFVLRQNDMRCSTEEKMVRALSMDQVERK